VAVSEAAALSKGAICIININIKMACNYY